MKKRSLVFLCLLWTHAAFSQAGNYDSTFHIDGITGYFFDDLFVTAGQVKLQDDGKLVVAGSLISLANGTSEFITMRFTSSGLLDSSFNATGIAFANINYNEGAYGVVIQQDGKIVVAGVTAPTSNDLAILVVRYLEDGSLDPDFGTDGILTINLSSDWENANAIGIFPNGKLVVGGGAYASSSDGGYAALIVLNEDGTLDTGFGSNGVLLISSPSGIPAITSLAVQSDEKILATGRWKDGIYYDLFISRVDTNGFFDPDFSDDGMVVISVSGNNDFPHKIITQPDSKIVVAGTTNFTTQMNFVLRCETDGTLDSSFAMDGISAFTFDQYAGGCEGIAIQSDGKFVLSGYKDDQYGINHATVGRINSAGTIDSTFGTDGFVYLAGDRYRDVLIQPDHKIVALGDHAVNPFGSEVFLARYLNDIYPTGAVQFPGDVSSLIIYPDPVTDLAIIEYELSQPSMVTLNLSDLSGKVFRTLISGNKVAGRHKKEFSFSQFASGIYLLQLKVNEKSVAVKIVKH